jgi:hypothetical protein
MTWHPGAAALWAISGMARSRSPARSLLQVATNRRMSSIAGAAEQRADSLSVRAMPRSVSRIAGWRVSSGSLAMRCARAMAATRRRKAEVA